MRGDPARVCPSAYGLKNHRNYRNTCDKTGDGKTPILRRPRSWDGLLLNNGKVRAASRRDYSASYAASSGLSQKANAGSDNFSHATSSGAIFRCAGSSRSN